jgi:hypothetical protein
VYWDTSWFHKFQDHVIVQALITSLWSQRSRFNQSPFCVEFMAEKVTMGPDFLWVLWYCHSYSTNAVHLYFIHLPPTLYNTRHTQGFNLTHTSGYKSNTLRCLKPNQFHSLQRPIMYATIHSCKPQLHISKSEISSSWNQTTEKVINL